MNPSPHPISWNVTLEGDLGMPGAVVPPGARELLVPPMLLQSRGDKQIRQNQQWSFPGEGRTGDGDFSFHHQGAALVNIILERPGY